MHVFDAEKFMVKLTGTASNTLNALQSTLARIIFENMFGLYLSIKVV